MYRTRPFIALVSLALAVGCAASREELLDPMVGQDVDVAIEALGQPDETIELGAGRHLYVWRRVYDYDVGQQSIRSFHDRHDDWLFGDEPAIVEARVCSTRLAVGFDFRVESWDYGCETALIERDGWRDPDWAPHGRIRPD